MKTETKYYLALTHVGVQMFLVLMSGGLFICAAGLFWEWASELGAVLLIGLYAFQITSLVIGAVLEKNWRRRTALWLFLVLVFGSLLFIAIEDKAGFSAWGLFEVAVALGFPIGYFCQSFLELIRINKVVKEDGEPLEDTFGDDDI